MALLTDFLAANELSRSAKAASGAQKGAYQNAMLQQFGQQMLQDQYGRPYADMGLDYRLLLDYLNTGRMPEQTSMTPQEMAEYEQLAGQRDELLRLRAGYTSSPTGSRSTQRAFANYVSGIDQKLQRLAALEDRKRQADAYGLISSGSLLQKSPLYGLQMKESEQGINRAMAARGMYGSSAATNALARSGERIGANEAERQYGRIAGTLGQMMGQGNQYVAGMGQTAGNMGNLTTNYGNQKADNAMWQGQNRASMYQNIGDTFTGAANTLLRFGGLG